MPRAKVIQNEWMKEEIDEILEYYKPITIPVSITIKGRQKILGFSEVERILRKAKLISLEPCWCRLKLKNCDAPIDVCICVDREAELAISERDGWKVDLKEAMAALRKTHKAGLVHMAYEFEGGEMRSICSCCACCCHTLAAITRFGYGDIVGRADVVAVHNSSKCNDCKLCVSKCHFYAWDLVGGRVHHYPLKCVGCGVCASFCPTGSIRMVKRKTPHPIKGKKRGRGKPLPSKIKRRYREAD